MDKKTLGWVNTRNPAQNQEGVSLAPVETSHEVMRIWTNGNENKEYFLLENRQKINSDSSSPSDGLLIFHIDENIVTWVNNDNSLHTATSITAHIFDLIPPTGGRASTIFFNHGVDKFAKFDNMLTDMRKFLDYVKARHCNASPILVKAKDKLEGPEAVQTTGYNSKRNLLL